MREQHDQNSLKFSRFDRRKLIAYVLAALLTGMAAGFIGPFGSYQSMYTGPRYLFWIAAVSAGWLVMLVISYGLRPALARFSLPGWVLMLIVAAIGSFPILLEVRLLDIWLTFGPIDSSPFWLDYLQVYFITALFSLIQWRLIEHRSLDVPWHKAEERTEAVGETNTGPNTDLGPLRLERMPDGLAGEILCLEMEDHYVRVHTTQGNGLVLLRLGDAIRELEGRDGLQVHRSWWVARSSVTGREREGSRQILLLSNGLRVPVSRTYGKVLREAGWLD